MKDIKIIEIMELFDEGEVTTADQIDRPERALEKEMYKDFMDRNPLAGGGMLVQPGFGGTRQGYAKDKKGYGQDADPLTKEQKKNIKLYNKNVEKYGGVKFEDIPNTGKGNSDKRYGIKTGKITGTGYDFDRSKIDYRESAAYKKSITPKGYISSTELFELIDNPKLKSGNFQQARKFERNPKKYPGKKNYVYNYIKKLLNEKQVGKAGSESLAAQKFFYRKPTKAELDKINSFIDSRILETGTVENVKIFHKEFGKLFEGKKTKGFFNDTLSLDKARAALKKYGINATDSQLARAMMRLGQIYDGHTFQNEINIPKNKSAGKFIEKSFNELDIYNGWRSASYDAAMDDINKVMAKSSGDIRSFKYTLNNYIKENYPQIFKNYDVNEIFSLTTSSVRGSYPYAYFIDLTKNDINQKVLSSFQGKASIAEGKIQKAITNFRRTGNQKFYDEAVKVADVFNNTTRKNFLSDERIIKAGGVNALKLEIGSQQQIKDKVGFASEYYKKNNLKKWKDQGIDIDAHTAKSGYVKTFDNKTPPKGVVTFQDVVKDGKVDEKQFKTLLASFSANPKCRASFSKKEGGRINYATGPASLSECALSGKNRLEKVIKTGVKLGGQEGALATQILRAGRSLGSAFTLSGLFGPAAIAFTAAAEAGIVGYDMLTTGKTFKETIGDSLFNYALGEKTKIDPDKELIKRFGKKDNQGNFLIQGMTADKLEGIKNVLKQTNTLNTILKQNLKVEDLADQVKFQNLQPKDQFMIADDEMLQADTAMRTRQSLEDEQQKLKEILTNYRSKPPVGLSMEDTIIANMASDQFFKEKQDLADAVKAAEIQKLESFGPVLTGKLFPKFEAGRQEDLLNLRAVDNPAAAYAIESYENPDLNRFTPIRPFGLAGGGIAKLAGIDEGPQTVSMNPDSQGLQSLKNRVKNI